MTEKQKYRAVPFTLNNYTSEDEAKVLALQESVVYMVVGKEVGEQGTPHYQGYLYFKNARTLSSLKKMLPRAHFSVPAKGTHMQNKTYCTKGGDILIEHGEIPSQGQRNDLTEVIVSCKKGTTTQELLEEHTTVYAKYPKFVELCKRTYATPRDPTIAPEVKCYYGEAGAGKTKTAYEEFEGKCFMKKPSTKDWWDGYDGHKNVIIDEADKGYIKLCEMLDILDRYPCKVNVKGSVVEFVATKIILTANKHPKDWYSNCSTQERKGLLRRMTEIRKFGSIEESDSDSEDLLEKKSQLYL